MAKIVVSPWLFRLTIVDRLPVDEHLHHSQVALEVLCL